MRSLPLGRPGAPGALQRSAQLGAIGKQRLERLLQQAGPQRLIANHGEVRAAESG